MNDNGFVKIYRSITNCEFWGKPNAVVLFIYLIMAASLAPTTFKGTKLQRGQLVTTVSELSAKTGLTVQQVRTALKTLKLTNTVTNKTSPQNSIITVINFDKYQNVTNTLTNHQQTANKRLTNEQQTYYIKEDKEDKEDKEVEKKEVGEPPTISPPPSTTTQILVEKYGIDNYNDCVKRIKNWKSKHKIAGGVSADMVAKWLAEDMATGKISITADCNLIGDSSFDVDELERKTIEEYKEKCE